MKINALKKVRNYNNTALEIDKIKKGVGFDSVKESIEIDKNGV